MNVDKITQLVVNNTKGLISNKVSTIANATAKTAEDGGSKILSSLNQLALSAKMSVHKSQPPVELAKYIEFTPAKTINEAREFAQEHLKMLSYDLEDVDVANFINEALCKYNNISNDHKRVFSMIRSEKFFGNLGFYEVDSMPANHNFMLLVSELNLKDILGTPEQIQVLTNIMSRDVLNNPKIKLSKKQTEFLNRALKDPNALSIGEKKLLNDIACDAVGLCDLFDNNKEIYGIYLRNRNIYQYLKDTSQYLSFDEFLKLPEAKRKKIISNIQRNCSSDARLRIPEGSPFSSVFHEIGHAVHRQKIGKKKFVECKYYDGSESFISIINASEKFKKELGKQMSTHISYRISDYACVCPAEFVAEVFSGLVTGQKFDNKIMNLYNKLGGPSVGL